ncbi:MAG: hypothetical protein IJS48_08140 [Prevotella sp.]|nr:hypothetical protein [Prevotella sp.]
MNNKVVYVKPTIEIVWIKTGNCLMAGSMRQSLEPESVENIETGSFGSRKIDSIWDDEEE